MALATIALLQADRGDVAGATATAAAIHDAELLYGPLKHIGIRADRRS